MLSAIEILLGTLRINTTFPIEISKAMSFSYCIILTFKVPITTAADDILKYFFFIVFSEIKKTCHFVWIFFSTHEMTSLIFPWKENESVVCYNFVCHFKGNKTHIRGMEKLSREVTVKIILPPF